MGQTAHGASPLPGALARYLEVPLGDEARKETAELLMTAPAIIVRPGATVAEAAWSPVPVVVCERVESLPG